jgi:hypothetical protein
LRGEKLPQIPHDKKTIQRIPVPVLRGIVIKCL